MDFHFTPVLRLPLTDLGTNIASHQEWGPCAKLELKAMSCLEAYGVYRGKEKCKDLIADYQECFVNRTQMKRTKIMRLERHRQYFKGERKEHYMDDVKASSA